MVGFIMIYAVRNSVWHAQSLQNLGMAIDVPLRVMMLLEAGGMTQVYAGVMVPVAPVCSLAQVRAREYEGRSTQRPLSERSNKVEGLPLPEHSRHRRGVCIKPLSSGHTHTETSSLASPRPRGAAARHGPLRTCEFSMQPNTKFWSGIHTGIEIAGRRPCDLC